MIKCPICGGVVQGDKCNDCGTVLEQEDLKAEPKHREVAGRIVTVRFGRSTSSNYNRAVALAKSYVSYEEFGEGKEIVHSVSFPIEDVDDISAVYNLVRQWKSSELLIDGVLQTNNYAAYAVDCYNARSRAYDPKEYCMSKDDEYEGNDNDFGCRHTGIQLYRGWGLKGYGTMDKQGNFHVDKARIMHTVRQRLDMYVLCPALDVDKVIRRVNLIPDVINPKTNRNWEYVTEWDGDREVAVAVRKKYKRKGATYPIDESSSRSEREVVIEVPYPSSKLKPQRAGCGCGSVLTLGLLSLVLMILTL